jgi:hypothetical protein
MVVLVRVVMVVTVLVRLLNGLRTKRQDEVTMRCRVGMAVDATSVPVGCLSQRVESSQRS